MVQLATRPCSGGLRGWKLWGHTSESVVSQHAMTSKHWHASCRTIDMLFPRPTTEPAWQLALALDASLCLPPAPACVLSPYRTADSPSSQPSR